MQPDPRSWTVPTIPADVTRISCRLGVTYVRSGAGAQYWCDEGPNPWAWHEAELMAKRGPLTEVTDAP